jgi:hypothetical protein
MATLIEREAYHTARHAEVEASQNRYLRLCDQIGLVYSPLLKVRRAQLHAVLSLGAATPDLIVVRQVIVMVRC